MDPLLAGILIMFALFAIFTLVENFIRQKFKKKETKPEKDNIKTPRKAKGKGIDIKQLQTTAAQLNEKIKQNDNKINHVSQLINSLEYSRPTNTR